MLVDIQNHFTTVIMTRKTRSGFKARSHIRSYTLSDGLHFAGVCPFVNIGPNDGSASGFVTAAGAAGSAVVFCYPMIGSVSSSAPDLCKWLSNIVVQFSRWRLVRLRVHYEPLIAPTITTGTDGAGATQAQLLITAPLTGNLMFEADSDGTSASTFANMEFEPNSTLFRPWQRFSMNCDVRNQWMVTCGGGTEVYKTSAGKFTCRFNASDPNATGIYGRLWWDFDIQVKCPTFAAGTTLSETPREEEEKKDSDVVYVRSVSSSSLSSVPRLSSARTLTKRE
jgi:hypothetical protein